MRKLFDHTCEDCGVTDEHFVEFEEKIQECPACGGPANRIISPVRWLEGQAEGFPGADMKWAKQTTKRHADAGQAHQGTAAQIGGLHK